VVFINTRMKATVLEDASLEVLQKQRVAAKVVCLQAAERNVESCKLKEEVEAELNGSPARVG
jgi:hypothetical protein